MRAPLAEPFEKFRNLFAQAQQAHPKDPNAVTLATVDASGRPSARIVLMKDFDQRGFVFFTNQQSRKGRELLEQRVAALVFYWPELDSQVRIEGEAQPVTDAENEAYFATRPRVSQLGAWASEQSRPLDSRETLLARLDALTRQHDGKPVPRPPHWGGFRLSPTSIEFWRAGEFRLHERSLYTRAGEGWSVTLLNP